MQHGKIASVRTLKESQEMFGRMNEVLKDSNGGWNEAGSVSQAAWTPIVIIFLEWVSAGLSRRGSAQWGGELHPPARRSHRPTFFLYLFHICSASVWPLLPLSNAVLHIWSNCFSSDFHRTNGPSAQGTKDEVKHLKLSEIFEPRQIIYYSYINVLYMLSCVQHIVLVFDIRVLFPVP